MNLWKRYLAWRQRHVVRIDLEPDGFAVAGYKRRTAIAWADIDRISAYKRDLYTVDLLCLAILAGDDLVEVHERMPGFEAFDERLHERLALSPEWKLTVLFPAFETNATEIYVRA